MTLPSTRELLLAYDAQRERTLQQEMGMSQLGRCRRQTGYMLAGFPADPDFTENGVQAVMGTAIHELAAEGARLVIPEAYAEKLIVWFGGLKGHLDLYHDGVVRDIKTKGYTLQVENIRQNGPPQGERFQVHTYAAGAILGGLDVHTVQLDYVARDSGEEYLFSEPFSPQVVGEAMAWLEDVRKTPPSFLSRDFRPDSAVCQSCKFFSRCWQVPRGREDRTALFLDDPDIAHWAKQLEAARAVRKRAEEDEKDARGALDALRTISRPGEKEDIAVPGLDKVIRIAMNNGKRSPDMPQIAMDYKRAGARPPMQTGEPIVKITLVKPRKDQA
jgi:hypothetical protein